MSPSDDSQARDLTKRILEKVATDPQFRKSLLDNPQKAIAGSEFRSGMDKLVSDRAESLSQQRSQCTWTCHWTGDTFIY